MEEDTEDMQFAPSDQIQRFPASLMSHTSYNPLLMLQHEPTQLSYTLPPGVQYAAMNRLPNEWANFSVYEQRKRRYEYERRLRNPPHITQGLDLKYWEARAEYPLLVPRRQDFRTYDDYVHASRDFSMELHRLQMRAQAARARDHPKVRHYLKSIFKDNLFEKMSQLVGLGAAMAGYPFLGAGMGLAGPITQHQFDHATLKQKLKASKRMLKNPHNLYFEKRSGEWLTLTEPKEADLDDHNSLWKYGLDQPVSLLRSVAELEDHHGVVESRHKRFEREMRALGQNYRLMMQLGKANIQQKTAKTIVFNVVKNVVALADFAEHMTQMEAVVGDTFISEENRRMLAVGYQLLNGVAETGDVWTEMSRAMNIDDVQTELLRQEMKFPDAVAYMARQTIRDVKNMEKLGKVSLKIDRKDALVFKKLGLLAEKNLKPQSIDTLQAAKIIPDGSVVGAISNYEKAQALGARTAMLRKMTEPDQPVYEKQADQLTAAKIDAMRHYPGVVPTSGSVIHKKVTRPVNLPDLIKGYKDVLKKEDLPPKKRAGMEKRLRELRRTRRMQARTRQQARQPRRRRAKVRFAKPASLIGVFGLTVIKLQYEMD